MKGDHHSTGGRKKDATNNNEEAIIFIKWAQKKRERLKLSCKAKKGSFCMTQGRRTEECNSTPKRGVGEGHILRLRGKQLERVRGPSFGSVLLLTILSRSIPS